LLASPAPFVLRPQIWGVVCIAALDAMRYGMRVLYAMAHTEAEQRADAEAQRLRDGGLRQAALEEVWFGAPRADLAPPGAPPAVRAGARAAAAFWASLQDFASLHSGGAGGWAPAAGLAADHPFVAGCAAAPGELVVVVPPGQAGG
jgi:hypothetical protein